MIGRYHNGSSQPFCLRLDVLRCGVLLILCVLLVACRPGFEESLADADASRASRDYVAAAEAYQAMATQFSDHARAPEVVLHLADLQYYHFDDSAAARKNYRELVQRWPLAPAAMLAYLRLSELAQRKEQYVAAIEALELLLQYFPAYPERHHLRLKIGRYYVKAKRYAQARVELLRLADNADVDQALRAQAVFEVAESWALEGDIDAALAQYAQVEEEFPESDWATRAHDQRLALRLNERAGQKSLSPQQMDALNAMFAERTQAADVREAREVEATIEITARTGRKIKVWAEIAGTEAERVQGLKHRKYLPPSHGMWFIFPELTTQSFWMKDTPLALDLIFVGTDLYVSEIIAGAKPNSTESLKPTKPYLYVLEVSAGFAKANAIGPGSRVIWTPQPSVGRWGG